MILDLRNLVRPHRSGVLAVLMAYVLVCSYFEISWLSSPDAGGRPFTLSTLGCMLMPWNCPAAKPQPPEPILAQYQVTPLIYCPRCKVRKKETDCHVNVYDTSTNHIIQSLDFDANNFWEAVYDPSSIQTDPYSKGLRIERSCRNESDTYFIYLPAGFSIKMLREHK